MCTQKRCNFILWLLGILNISLKQNVFMYYTHILRIPTTYIHIGIYITLIGVTTTSPYILCSAYYLHSTPSLSCIIGMYIASPKKNLPRTKKRKIKTKARSIDWVLILSLCRFEVLVLPAFVGKCYDRFLLLRENGSGSPGR